MDEKELIDIIQEALAHFANVCPYCQREINICVPEGEIEAWLREGEGF